MGLTAAYLIGERLIARAERRRWSSVEQAIEQRVVRGAVAVVMGFTYAPTTRTQLDLESQEPVPTYQDLVFNPTAALAFVNDRLLPVTRKYTSLRPPPNMTVDFTGLSAEDWSMVRGGIDRASWYTFQSILLFGQRPAPSV